MVGRRPARGRARSTVVALAVAAMTLLQLPALQARPGDPDPTFGTGGIVTDNGAGAEIGSAIVKQPDGKLVVAGRALNSDGNYDFLVARYNGNGSPDASFGTLGTGKVTIAFSPTSNEFAFAVALGPGGQIVVAGTTNAPGRNAIAVARLNADGTPDAGFGSGGKATPTLVGQFLDRASGVAIDSSGRPVVVGQTFNGTDDDFVVVRYSTLGVLDGNWNGTGIVVTPIGTGNDRAYSVAIQPDGKIVVGGSSATTHKDDFAVARYNTNGTLDTAGFNSSGTGSPAGTVVKDIIGDVDQAFAIGIQPWDGKIVAAGSSSNGVDDDFAVARFNTNGSIDSAGFNSAATGAPAGTVRTAIGTSDDVAQALFLQPTDHRILLAGASKGATDKNFALARYNPNGTLDNDFGSAGKLVTGGTNDDESFAVTELDDLRIVVAGDFDKGVDPSLAIVQLLGETVRASDTSVIVSADGPTSAVFTVTVAVPSLVDVVVTYATQDGTAHAGIDYTATSGTVTIPAGSTSNTVSVPVAANGSIKPDSTFLLKLTNATAASIETPQATATLLEHHARKYWLIASDGGVFAFGTAGFFGSTGSIKLVKPVVGGVATNSGNGYWMVASDGGIFAFGDAPFKGSAGGLKLNQPVVGMAAVPQTGGYWLVASDGGIFSYGAPFFGSTGSIKLNQPIVGMAATPTGNGYWLVASDGGIFAYGDAGFFGSTGSLKLNKPVVGMAPTPTGKGYWLVASDGGIFSFGDAQFLGSTGGLTLNKPVVGMSATGSGNGYWLVASDGGIFAYGDAEFEGSTGSIKLNQPIVGMASR